MLDAWFDLLSGELEDIIIVYISVALGGRPFSVVLRRQGIYYYIFHVQSSSSIVFNGKRVRVR